VELTDRFEGLDRGIAVLQIAASDRKGEHVEHQIARIDSVAVDTQIVDTIGDPHFIGRRFRHPFFIDDETHEGGSELFGERTDGV
jgi:hypothetical protein